MTKRPATGVAEQEANQPKAKSERTPPNLKAMAGRIGGLRSAAKGDMADLGRRGQQGLRQRFHDQTDPSLPDEERWRRGDLLLKAHWATMQRKGQATLRAKRAKQQVAS